MLDMISTSDKWSNSDSKRTFFKNTIQCFGNTGLLLHGGATFGLFHLGVVKTLYENNLLPKIITGSAIGALIAALVCVKTDSEMPSIFDEKGINLEAFSKKDNKGALMRKIKRFIERGYFLDVTVLEECIKANLADITFEVR